LDAVNSNQPDLLALVCFIADLLKLKLPHAVVYFNKLTQTSVFNEVVKCYA
jgi:hypothetical protein